MPTEDPAVVVSAARTPLGRFMGNLAALPASALGACAIAGALDRGKMPVSQVDEVLMGCVLLAGQGQAPARQAAARWRGRYDRQQGLRLPWPCATVGPSWPKSVAMLPTVKPPHCSPPPIISGSIAAWTATAHLRIAF